MNTKLPTAAHCSQDAGTILLYRDELLKAQEAVVVLKDALDKVLNVLGELSDIIGQNANIWMKWDIEKVTAVLDNLQNPKIDRAAPGHHWGDCTFYSSIINDRPHDGICTCGYGWSIVAQGHGDYSQMYSAELMNKLKGT